jgi:hypothetical protein
MSVRNAGLKKEIKLNFDDHFELFNFSRAMTTKTSIPCRYQAL